MTLIHRCLPLAVLSLACTAAGAQSMAAGLWEHSLNPSSVGGQAEMALALAQKQLAALPPAQRRQIEQMMASRGVAVDARGTSFKACVTPEQAARPAEPPLADGCTYQVLQRQGDQLKVDYQCSAPRPVRGEAEVTFSSDKAYTGTSTVATEINGTSQTMKLAMSGRWLASDCGDVKPMSAR